VVVTARDPLNCRLLLNCTEEASVDRPAADIFTTVAEEVVIVVEVNVLDQGNMEEEETFTLAWVRIFNHVVLFAEPIDLVWVDTIVAMDAKAV